MIDTIANSLRRFVQGTLRLGDLQTALQGVVTFDFADRRQCAVYFSPDVRLPSVTFTCTEMVGALDRYLAFDWSEEDLHDWATVIRMLDSYFDLEIGKCAPDDVWEMIDELMARGVSETLDREYVKQLRGRLI